MTGAECVIRCLEREGVELIFAYPGASSMELHQALIDSTIRVVLPRHEQGGCFAAGGYARRSGRVGVCMATSGPGATNLVTGITDACADSIPLVVITAQVDQRLIGKNAFQETDIIGMTRPCVKHSYLVLSAEEIPQTVKDAFYLASHGRKGPIVIDISRDVLRGKCTASFAEAPSPRLTAVEAAAPSMEEPAARLHELLCRSHRPCIFAGGGVIHGEACEELTRFARANRLPVATSLMGVGAFPETDPLSLKWLGMHGSHYANRAVNECDLLIGLGVRFSDRVTGDIQSFAPHAIIVHADIDPSEINKNKPADMAIVGDVRQLLRRLNEFPPCPPREAWLAQLEEWKRKYPLSYGKPEGQEISGPDVIEALYRLTGGEATLVTGVGQNQMWTAQGYTFTHPRQLLTSGGLGAMGFGLPAAIGALLAEPNRLTVLVDGDGSFQMNIQELATLYAEQLPLKMLILDNQQLGLVAQWENRYYRMRHGNTDLAVPSAGRPYPDFCRIASGYLISGQEVTTINELDSAIQAMLTASGPYLLDVHIRKTEYVYPAIPPGKTCNETILNPILG